MSAVIWLGIVAVWAFVLIPTWVRRSDIHWRSSGDASGARDKIGRAARVVSRSGSGAASGARGAGTGARGTVPGMRRPSSTSRRAVAAASSGSGASRRATALLDRPARGASSVMEAPTETLTAIRVDEPPTEQMTPVQAEPEYTHRTPQIPTGDDAGTNVTSAQTADPVATEAPMTPTHTSRPAPRSRVTRVTQSTPTPQVQRARRLVWIGATALATLLLAFVFKGWWIALNLVADVALVAYLRHLRGIAVQRQAARRSRRQSGHADEERLGEVRERVAARAPRRAPAPRHRAEPAPTRASAAPVTTPAATAPTPAAPVAPEEAPVEFIDLTDDAMYDDCPTTELISARAV